jgi:hypothetical protein
MTPSTDKTDLYCAIIALAFFATVILAMLLSSIDTYLTYRANERDIQREHERTMKRKPKNKKR